MQQETASDAPTTITISEKVLFDTGNTEWILAAANAGVYFICNPTATSVGKMMSGLLRQPHEVDFVLSSTVSRACIGVWLDVPLKVIEGLNANYIYDILKNMLDGTVNITTLQDDYYVSEFYEGRLRGFHSRYALSLE